MPTVHIVLFISHGPLQGNEISSDAQGAGSRVGFEQDTCIAKQFNAVALNFPWVCNIKPWLHFRTGRQLNPDHSSRG